MSLKVRKACQEILDTIPLLRNFHVEVNKTYKCLDLVSECGKSLVIIHGISFSRANPSKDEIEYAAELFNAFLVKHRSKLESCIKQNQANKSLANKIEALIKELNICTRFKNNYVGVPKNYVQFHHNNLRCDISIKPKIALYKVEIIERNNLEVSDVYEAVQFIDRNEKKFKLYEDSLHKYQEGKDTLAEIESELNTCTI